MEFKGNEVKAGVIIIAAVLALGIFLVAMLGVRFDRDTKPYHVYLDYVGGITEGTLVKYRGLNVGQVIELILPEGQQYQIGLLIEVQKDTPVRSDSRAFITSISLMSEQHLEISAGSPEAEILPPGSVIPSKEVLSFAQMAEMMTELGDQVQVLMTRVSDLFNDQNRAHLASIMGGSDTLMQDLRRPALETVNALQDMSRQLAAVGANLTALTDTSDGNITRVLANLERGTADMQQLMDQFNATLNQLRATMSANDRNLGEIVENFQATSQNMEEFSRMIKAQPWLLVRKAAPPERKIK